MIALHCQPVKFIPHLRCCRVLLGTTQLCHHSGRLQMFPAVSQDSAAAEARRSDFTTTKHGPRSKGDELPSTSSKSTSIRHTAVEVRSPPISTKILKFSVPSCNWVQINWSRSRSKQFSSSIWQNGNRRRLSSTNSGLLSIPITARACFVRICVHSPNEEPISKTPSALPTCVFAKRRYVIVSLTSNTRWGELGSTRVKREAEKEPSPPGKWSKTLETIGFFGSLSASPSTVSSLAWPCSAKAARSSSWGIPTWGICCATIAWQCFKLLRLSTATISPGWKSSNRLKAQPSEKWPRLSQGFCAHCHA